VPPPPGLALGLPKAKRAICCLFALSFAACEPQTRPAGGELPLTLEETFGENGESCGRALSVLHTDYSSTSISLLRLDGEVLSAPFFSSGTQAAGLNAPLGGDVGFPSQRMSELVLLDRYPTSVLTFVDPESAKVRGQLDVGDGFAANPHDYLPLSSNLALVSRYDRNPNSDEPEGSDLVVIDSKKLSLKSTFSLEGILSDQERADKVVPHPSQLLALGETIAVSVTAHTKSFKDAAIGRVVLIDDILGEPELRQVMLPELKNCSVLVLSPSHRELSVGCNGLIDASDQAGPEFSGIVRLRVTQKDGRSELEEIDRILASSIQKGPLGFSLEYFDETHLLATSYGALEGDDAGRPDSLLLFALEDGLKKPKVLLESEGTPFTLGGLACTPACARCFLADAARNGVHRIEPNEDAGEFELELFRIDDGIGLPPRSLGLL